MNTALDNWVRVMQEHYACDECDKCIPCGVCQCTDNVDCPNKGGSNNG